MSELPPEEPRVEEPRVEEPPPETADDDANVAHPVPVDSAAARDGDGGTPVGSLPPSLGD
ncbi:hypothetical protein ACFRIB_04625 [Streptomyces mirabilis]|uniref:hypothetical protein n=1 Tax=Streptomyces mirabilis TaxID=68239 RepID=UPI00331C5AF9